jgi:hypothetical protein
MLKHRVLQVSHKKDDFLQRRNGFPEKDTAFCNAEMASREKRLFSVMQKWLFSPNLTI